MNTIIAVQSEETCLKAADIIKKSGLVAFPTETVYGLGSCMEPESVKKIFEVKGRDEGKPLSVLVSSIEDIKAVVDTDEKMLKMLKKAEEKFWPGPLTIILPKKAEVSDVITAGTKTIGVRMPADDFALSLIRKVGTPVVTTSANLSGQPAAVNSKEAIDILDGKIDMIVKGNDCPVGQASTVALFTGNGFKILRQGPVTLEQLEDILK